jgi:16S rRNA (uracil1498-N3)-methyltransferase
MRRILVSKAVVGRIDLGSAEAHHLRDVLRLGVGAEVEVFDRAGDSGRGRIVSADGRGVTIEVEKIGRAVAGKCRLTIAAAVPKAARADWMIEKLGELGVDVFIPLMTRRSVVAPKGSAKNERWNRLATESARQSGRAGVMRIERLMELAQLIEQARAEGIGLWHLSPEEESVSIFEMLPALPAELMVLVGPEGGWSPEESATFETARSIAVRLTRTILRVETAAVAAAAVIESALT